MRVCALIAVASLFTPAFAADPALNFEDDIVPILEVRCIRCHGAEARKGGLDLRRRFAILAGGDGGTSLVPGKPEESVLLEKIVSKEMPPPEEDPLDAKQIEVLRKWIAAGAPTKTNKEPPLEATEADSDVTDEDRQHWAFQPPVRIEPPVVQRTERVRTPIDAFLLAKLEAQGLTFNADADKRTLLRRVCFDLTGLPPTPEQIAAFLADDAPQAYERLVNQLLDSPRYGEQWGRHWLDVAGYADSDGYLEADRERPTAWRYRDYVIKALNNDLPYDQFIREQLAGDELSDWRRADELSPQVVDQLVATGFLRTAADPTYPGYKEKTEIHKVLADTMQIFGSAFLGVTMQCARCHAHKSEPISQRDYYSLLAVFQAALDPEPAKWQVSIERAIPQATEAELARINERNQQVDQRIARLAQEREELQQRFRGKLIQEKLATAHLPIDEPFDADPWSPARDWTPQHQGTAKSCISEIKAGVLQVTKIDGMVGYALVRLQKPLWLPGEFAAEFNFRWTGHDAEPAKSTAMQGVAIHLRDPQGRIIATAGIIDENIDQRGSPILGINGGQDLIEQNLKQLGAAVPPSDTKQKLPATGTARVKLTRNAAGEIAIHFDGGGLQTALTGQDAGLVAQVELEVRRYIHPGATFDGIELDHVTVSGPSTPLADDVRGTVQAALLVAADKRTDEQKSLLNERAPRVQFVDEELKARYPSYGEDLADLTSAQTAEKQLKRTVPQIRGVVDLGEQGPVSHVLRRGDFNTPGRAVEPNVPAVLAPRDYHMQPQPAYKTTGRRRALAEWLVSPQHPTTARVHVNRVWAQHFGRGLVESLDDFGHNTAPPTHPELLDWLATEFMARGWSQKGLHRLIVTSTAYRQTSTFDPSKAAVDSDNTLLWAYRPRRHTGEVVRDTVLAVAGKLNLDMFGPPTQVQLQGDGSVITSDDAAGNRRSIYLKVRRSQALTLLDVFDTPRMEINCIRRNEATVPTQALALLNSPLLDSAAKALAERIAAMSPDRNGRIEAAWSLLFSRPPNDNERRSVNDFLDRFTDLQLGDKAATASTTNRQAAETTAWPHVALMLLNTNEFLYVD